ncbi:MAG TPA: anion transporter [Stellaceae bacterium]|nr:anion transporter [Stellaceae bacterium]
MSEPLRIATAAIFAVTYVALALGKLPGLRIDRTGIALAGATLMLAAGSLSLGEAGQAVDFATLALLLGLMILVGNLRLSGFFRLVNGWVVARARHPLPLLAAVIVSSGFFSAFLLNDAICLVMTPIVLDIVARLRREPAPYLLAVAMAANIGSTATITGNPQNILIGSFSGIPYTRFAAALSPVALIGLVLTFALVALLHPAEFRRRGEFEATAPPTHLHRPLALKSLAVTLAMIAAFFAGAPPALAALVAGSVLLVAAGVPSERIYREVDWPLLLMFAGLFVVVAGFEKALLTPDVAAAVGRLRLDQVPVLSVVTAVLSNLVSNVPAVLVLKPFIAAAGEPQRTWLVVAMASTLAGNLTVLGSVANLIVVQIARARGVDIGFWSYFRVGAPLTVLTILVGIWWL